MGLDMYLTKKTYVKNWDHMKEEDRHAVMIMKGWQPCAHVKPERISSIEEEVGRWRKANAIHNWFVENVQDGNDDCESHYVSQEKMQELLDCVNLVLGASVVAPGMVKNGATLVDGNWKDNMELGEGISNPEIAKEHLPTGEGFFFGSTDYDQWYVADLKRTKEILELALAEIKEGDHSDYYYQASW